MSQSYSLSDLADATGIEARTIRSYIERGLLPSAHARGRGASYSGEHLARLHAIQALRRARPGLALSDIRILLQQLTPKQLRGLAGGSITAGVDSTNAIATDWSDDDASDEMELPRETDWNESATKLTGVERLVRILRGVGGFAAAAPQSTVQGWQRIAITPDVELSVRAEFTANQLAAFRELADLLRQLLQHPDALDQGGE